MPKPNINDYAEYYAGYIAYIEEDNALSALERLFLKTQTLLTRISEEQANFRYSPEKWSIKEVIGHILDAERVFSYRALRFSRGDITKLSGFDQDFYIINGQFNRRKLTDLAEEYRLVRESNLILFNTFDEAQLSRRGVANEKEITVNALLYIIAGHEAHHIQILQTKYLNILL